MSLEGKHQGSTFLVVGCAPSLGDIELYAPEDVVSIGANRVLNHPYFMPNYVMLCDRRPYSIDLKMGIYHSFSDQTTFLASTTIWDKNIKCHGFPPMDEPNFQYHPWRVGTMRSEINLETFSKPLCSCATIVGPMIQAAAIMGASKIGIVGVDLETPQDGNNHFYEDGDGEKLTYKNQPKDGKIDISPPGGLDRLRDLKNAIEKRGIEITNLSPVKDSPFSTVFPAYDFDDWIDANA